MSKRSNARKVIVVCPVCHGEREIRAVLARKYDVLVCATHHAKFADLKLAVPEGRIVKHTFGAAGHYDGYTYVTADPRAERSKYRAKAILAAGTGKPIPEPDYDVDDTSWIDKKLTTALTRELGTEGWEIADWVEEGRNCFTVKVYTDWGWAGFITGSPQEIADCLQQVKRETKETLDSPALKCSSCGKTLNPLAGKTQCGCGTVAYMAASWVSGDPFSVLSGALPYLDNAPDYDTVSDALTLELLSSMSGDWDGYCEDDPHSMGDLFERVIPGSTWTLLQGRLVGILPVGVGFHPSEFSTAILSVAETLGYSLEVFTYNDNRMSKMSGRMTLDDPDSNPLFPSWFTVSVNPDGLRWSVTVGVNETWNPAHPADNYRVEDSAREEAQESIYLDGIPVFEIGWQYDDFVHLSSYDGVAGAYMEKSVTVPFTAEALQEQLEAGMRCVNAAHDYMDMIHDEMRQRLEKEEADKSV